LTWQSFAAEPPDRDPQPVGASLDPLSRKLGVPRPSALASVFGHWSELVGEALAQHAQPASLRDGVLVVLVDQPAWASELLYFGGELRRRICEAIGDPGVDCVQVRVSPVWPPR
jgi:predicted nucleic acid-binding Zn ribbon protein